MFGGFGSQDHRGTPEKPGRVVTLIERSYWASLTDHHGSPADNRVWGTAYRIRPDKVDEVKEYLDIREINGYTIHYAPFHPAPDASAGPDSSNSGAGAGNPFLALVYIGTPDNDQFTGPQDPQALAEHIHRSEGPSGLNRDYLWELERALDGLSPASGDEHVSDLARRVREIDARVSAAVNGVTKQITPGEQDPSQEQQQSQHEFHKISSVDEQEETEKAV